MLSSFVRAANLKHWLAQPDCPPFIEECKRVFDQAFGNSEDDKNPISQSVFHPVPVFLCRIIKSQKVALCARHHYDHVTFSWMSMHLGNSLSCSIQMVTIQTNLFLVQSITLLLKMVWSSLCYSTGNNPPLAWLILFPLILTFMQKSIQQHFQRSSRWLNLNGSFRTMLGGTWMKNMLWCFHCPMYVQFYLNTLKL